MSGEKFFKMMVKTAHGDQAQLIRNIDTNLADLDDTAMQADVMGRLARYLVEHVNTDNAAITKCVGAALDLVKTHRDLLTKLAAKGGDDARDQVGWFLVEALRCTNFAKHDAGKIRYFKEVMEEAGLTIAGNPDKCIEFATFENLDYAAGTVTMEPF